MALDPNQFEVVGNAPATPDQFEVVGDKKPALDLSKVGTDPYEKYRLALAHGATPENYSELGIPASQNPDYDFIRATHGDPMLAVPLALGAKALGSVEKHMPVPARYALTGKDLSRYADTEEAEKFPFEPYVKLPEASPSEIASLPKALQGPATIGNTINKTVEQFSTPEQAAQLPALEFKPVQAMYLSHIAMNTPEMIRNIRDAKTPEERLQAETQLGLQLGMGALLARGLKGKAEPTPEVQGPYSLGRFMQTPKGAEPELSVENFEPLDTQSGAPLSPQELIARQSRAPVPEPAPEKPIKTFNLDEGGPNAIEERKQSEGNQPEHTGDASQRPPAQSSGGGGTPPSGEVPSPNEPIPRPGDARGTSDKETPPVSGPVESVLGMSPKEFTDTTKQWEGGLTGQAWRLGQSVQSLDDVGALKKAQDDASAISKDKSKPMEERMSAANKTQFFREAHEAATGTGSAGESLRKSNPNYQPPFPEGKERELVGMGGAVPSEFNPEGNEGREVYGIAHEVREARAKAGQVEPVPRGQGISAPDSVARGRQLLGSGVDPEQVLKNFETTKRFSADDMAVVRAHGEKLAQDARVTERKFGTNSPEYDAAYKKLSDWDARTKAMQTEWNKSGMAQQGQTDIDTGSFTGLRREFEAQTGKKFTPKQEKEAHEKADAVNQKADEVENARTDLITELDKDLSGMTDAEKRAIDAANKTVRDAAARRAEAENKQRVEEQRAKTEVANIQREAARKTKSAEDKFVRDEATRKSKEESQARVDAAKRERAAADLELERAKRAQDAVNKRARDAAAQRAKEARKELGMSLSERAWDKAREYIESGVTNFDDIRNKLATDMGMPVEKVTKALAQTKRAKYLTDELWKRQQEYRNLDQNAKRWVAEQSMPMIQKVVRAFPNLAFSAKVFGHGTVALGTHAPMVAFQPRFWKAYANDFVKMYKMVGSPAFYEMQVQDLLRRPNYTTARRAGLVNDPYQYEDYNSPEVTKWMGPVANMGNRGYSVLKILRQDMFDQYWNKLPKTAQIPEVAKAIADGVNHATGVVKMKAPPGSNIALFAPRLEASRAAWLAVDPLRALKTFTDWNNASMGEKQFAINQIKEKAWVVGTMLSLLALNEGILEASGSKQRVNVSDPMRRDWMKFKVGGLNVGYGNAMLSMARLPARLYKIRESDGGKLKNLVYPDEDTYSVLGEFARSQESPFASLATTLWFKSDWQNRPLPNSNRKVPKRLAARGVKPYTWPEFWTEQVLPIPAEEAAREVWKGGLGMSDEQIRQARKALATISVMAATGARVEDDTDVSP